MIFCFSLLTANYNAGPLIGIVVLYYVIGGGRKSYCIILFFTDNIKPVLSPCGGGGLF